MLALSAGLPKLAEYEFGLPVAVLSAIERALPRDREKERHKDPKHRLGPVLKCAGTFQLYDSISSFIFCNVSLF